MMSQCPVCGQHGNVLADLFSGAGGAGMGYHRAGWHVCGIDNRDQPRYPFCFVKADAMTYPLDWADAIHASPPCQSYSRAMSHLTSGYPRLIDPIRDRLTTSGRPWIIENVPGSRLPHQSDLFGAHGIELCGTMFNLRIWRHRLFQTSCPMVAPRGCDHSRLPLNPHYAASRDAMRRELPEGTPLEPAWRAAMGIDWMRDHEGREAIPPAYTEYIGAHLLDEVRA